MKVEQFLDSYRRLEEACREIGTDVIGLPNYMGLGDEDTNKLNISRQIRNFLSHNSDKSFISISDSQGEFIEKLTYMVMTKDDVCEKHLYKRGTYVLESEKCSDVILKLSKAERFYTLVMGDSRSNKDQIIGAVSILDISVGNVQSKSTKIGDLKMNKNISIGYVSATTKYKNAPKKDIVICTTDGTPNSKMLGILK